MFGAFDVSRQQYDRVWGPRRSCDKAAEAHCCGRRDCRSRNPGLPILNDSDCRLRLLDRLDDHETLALRRIVVPEAALLKGVRIAKETHCSADREARHSE